MGVVTLDMFLEAGQCLVGVDIETVEGVELQAGDITADGTTISSSTYPEQRGSVPVVHDRPCHPHVPAVDGQLRGVGGDQLVDDVSQPGQAGATVDHKELVVLPGGERDEDVSAGDGQAQPEGQVELHRVLPVVTAGLPAVGGSGGGQLAEVALVPTSVQVQVEVGVDLGR